MGVLSEIIHDVSGLSIADLLSGEWVSEGFEDQGDETDEFADIPYVEDDADIRLSIGKDKCDNTPLQVTLEPANLLRFVDAQRGKKKGEKYICAPFLLMEHQKDPDKYPGKHFFRQKAGVRMVKLLMFDLDRILNMALAEEIKAYLSKRYAGIWYETASHTPANPRARACLILDRYVNAEEQKILSLVIQGDIELAVNAEALRQAHGETALKFDQSVYLPYQPVYLPIVGAQLDNLGGGPIDVEATLQRATPEIRAGVHGRQTQPQGSSALPDGLYALVANLYGDMSHPETVQQLHDALFSLDPGMERAPWRSTVFGLADASRRGVSAAYDWAHEWSQQCPEKYDAQDLDRIWSDFDPNGGIHAETIFWQAQQHGWQLPEPGMTNDPTAVLHAATARAGAIRAQLDRFAGVSLILPSDHFDHGEASRNIFEVIGKTYTLFNRGGAVVEWLS